MMKQEEFDKLAGKAFDSIPERFRTKMGNVALCIEDMCAEDADLLGVFDGVSCVDRRLDDIAPLPDKIILYQRTIEVEAKETDGDVYRVIRETLIHEIAHCLGYEEAEIEEKFESKWKKEKAGD